ncbi:MAG: glucosyltransferase domain-containing protein [Lachnospiraceae bacterium]|nr:glucosyltransferase domain-containing protein [Lachnospiraceae bacterium]
MENVIKKNAKPVLVVWFLSIACYLPLIARGLTNSIDGLWASTYAQAGDWELSIGRWAWLFLDKARGGYGAEPFNSLLTLLLIVIASFVAMSMFMDTDYKIYVFSMLALCSTTVCCYLSYRYMSPTFGMSVLLATVGARLLVMESEDKKKSIILLLASVAVIVVSLGLYQANLGCFCVLVLLAMIKKTYDGESKKCGAIFVKALIVGAVSCILYKIAWDLCMWARKVQPADYNGASSLSVVKMIVALPRSLRDIFVAWVRYFGPKAGNYLFSPLRVLIFVVIFALVIFVGVKQLRKSVKNLVVYIVLCLLIPVGANIAFVLAPDASNALIQMTFPMAFTVPLLLSFLTSVEFKAEKVLVVCAALLLYGNIYAVGTDIDAMAQGSTSTYAIVNNIVTELNRQELLSGEREYAFFGNFEKNELFKKNVLFDKADNFAQFGRMNKKPDMVHKSCIGLVDDIGLNLKIINNDRYIAIYKSGVLDSMPAFPAEGSIAEYDGVVIVKVSEDY